MHRGIVKVSLSTSAVSKNPLKRDQEPAKVPLFSKKATEPAPLLRRFITPWCFLTHCEGSEARADQALGISLRA